MKAASKQNGATLAEENRRQRRQRKEGNTKKRSKRKGKQELGEKETKLVDLADKQ